MKIAVLVIGILLMLLSFIGLVISLALPELTNNRVDFEEALLGIIPSAIFLLIGFGITLLGAILLIMRKKKNQPIPAAPPRAGF